MKLPGVARVEGFLYPLVATSLLLGVLLIWQRTYEQSCLALASPGLVYIAISYGLLEYRLERKRFALDYYLDRRSSWRRWFRGSWLPVLISMVVALPLTIFLLAFVALSRSTDWLFRRRRPCSRQFCSSACQSGPGVTSGATSARAGDVPRSRTS